MMAGLMDKTPLKRVLILEENTDHLELLTGLLEENFTPIDIHTVETVEDCLDFLEQTEYDIIISGSFIHSISITERLSDIIARTKGTPVIIVSGRGDENMAAEVIKLGANEFLLKTKKNIEKLPQLFAKYFKKEKKGKLFTPPSLLDGEDVTNRLIRELDHLMQKARVLTSNIAIKGTNEEVNLDGLFAQIGRLRKLLKEQK